LPLVGMIRQAAPVQRVATSAADHVSDKTLVVCV
jgi:hypothetical protein